MGLSKAPIQLRSVLLPDPDSPTTAANSPFSKQNDTFFNASTLAFPFPYVLHKFSTFKISIIQPPFYKSNKDTLQLDEFNLTIP